VQTDIPPAAAPPMLELSRVVKSFGAETREDERLTRVVDRWRARTRVLWLRATLAGTSQNVVLVLIRLISIPDTFAGTSGRSIGLWIALLAALAVIAAGLLRAGEDL